MPTCTNCGSFVTPSFVRVFGGNDGQIRGCDNCKTQTELNSGIAARSSDEGVPFDPNGGGVTDPDDGPPSERGPPDL
ncbi:DUF7563 family protein [Halorarum salinum]|uniref:Small CPxCG-related zinc finger protein n=1 Tax=Halorarum salinum TaxID=2743089 RepID=A0A7D5QEQ7_9EURY|nr:hypothetical protein [Halobaculum salinum]QLG64300.1 hypothetical protein HUG12_21205 [Halobaculum salinum]